MDNSAQFDTSALYDAAQSEQAWPSHRRTIYCSVTGIPWAIVSEEYVQFYMKYFWRTNKQEADWFINRMQLFAGPSPMWQTKTPDMLVINQHADPCGFLVYLLNWVLKLEPAALAAHKNDIYALINWRWSMVELRRQLDKISVDFIHKINDTLLLMTGEGLYPEPHVFPARELDAYANEETLKRLMQTCRKYYERYKGRYSAQIVAGKFAHKVKHEIHAKTFLSAYNADKLAAKEQRDMVDLIIEDLFRELDAAALPEEHEAAKKKYGIKSATYALLRDVEKEQEKKPPVQIAKVHSVGDKVVLKFGSRKEIAS